MELSIVTTLYHSSPYLTEFYTRIKREAERITHNYEIIFVNDGSPDHSLDLAISLYERDDHVRVIDLSRNFGHHKAMMTGLIHARGELVFLIDCDLEEKPELLGQFYAELKRSGADVIYGVQETRKGGLFERVSGHLFFSLFNLLSNHPLPPNVTTVRLMNRRYVTNLIAHQERETVIAGLWVITGFNQMPITIQKNTRGSSNYNLGRKVAIFVNSVTSFSDRPLVFIFYLGCTIVFLSGLAALYLIVRRIFFGIFLEGWPSLIVSVWLLGGLNIFCLGVIGIYLSKVFIETKQRPYTIIKELYEWTDKSNNGSRAHPEKRGAILQSES